MTISEKITTLTIHLGPRAAMQFQQLCDVFGAQPTELIRLALGITSVASTAATKHLKLAIVTPSGNPLKEIVLPALRGPKSIGGEHSQLDSSGF